MNSRFISSSEQGAGAVIGTLMAVSVLAIVLSLFVTEYVPRWMEDKEAEHMMLVYNEFSSLKSTIDTQVMDARAQNSKSLVMYTPITLGTKGVSIFAPDSSGTLTLSPLGSTCRLRNTTTELAVSTGNIKYRSHNIYFIQQTYVYENGAIIVAQSAGDSIKIGPQFNIQKVGQFVEVSFTLTSVVCMSDSISGTQTLGIQTQVTTYYATSYTWPKGERIEIELTTDYPHAWEDYFNATLKAKALVYGPANDFIITTPTDTSVVVTIYNVQTLDVGLGSVDTRIERGWGGGGT
jgi:hypothetical protein